jgi:hypothetical protein
MYIILGHVRMGNLNDLRIRDSVGTMWITGIVGGVIGCECEEESER